MVCVMYYGCTGFGGLIDITRRGWMICLITMSYHGMPVQEWSASGPRPPMHKAEHKSLWLGWNLMQCDGYSARTIGINKSIYGESQTSHDLASISFVAVLWRWDSFVYQVQRTYDCAGTPNAKVAVYQIVKDAVCSYTRVCSGCNEGFYGPFCSTTREEQCAGIYVSNEDTGKCDKCPEGTHGPMCKETCPEQCEGPCHEGTGGYFFHLRKALQDHNVNHG